MTVPTREALEALRKLAEAATPGPWVEDIESIGQDCNHGQSYYCCGPYHQRGPEAEARSRSDAAYIAAANPTAILALLAELSALRAEVEALRADFETYEKTLTQISQWLSVQNAGVEKKLLPTPTQRGMLAMHTQIREVLDAARAKWEGKS